MLPPLLVAELSLPDTVLPESLDDDEVEPLEELEEAEDDESVLDEAVEPDELDPDELDPDDVDVDEPAPEESELDDWVSDELAFVACAACSAKNPRLSALAAATIPVTILMREVSRLLFMVQPSPPVFSSRCEKPFDFL